MVGAHSESVGLFTENSNGYLGTSDGWTDLSQHYHLIAHYDSAPDGTPVLAAPSSKG